MHINLLTWNKIQNGEIYFDERLKDFSFYRYTKFSSITKFTYTGLIEINTQHKTISFETDSNKKNYDATITSDAFSVTNDNYKELLEELLSLTDDSVYTLVLNEYKSLYFSKSKKPLEQIRLLERIK